MNRDWKTFSNVPRTSSSEITLSLDSSGTYRRVLKMGKVSIHHPLIDKSQTILIPSGMQALMKIILMCLKGIKPRNLEKSCLGVDLVT